MFAGQLVAIYIGPERGGTMNPVTSAEVSPRQGLEGDRYSVSVRGKQPKPDQEVTLIESEALEAARRDYKVEIDPAICRRNLITRGVPLNHLVGAEFRVGTVKLRGIELCEPCGHLQKLTFVGIRKALVHRGGLRAQVVEGGTLRVGDSIEPLGCGVPRGDSQTE